MRLIDADELKQNYTNSFVTAFGVKAGEMFKGVIDQTETALDVDNMIEELSKSMEKNTLFEQGFHHALEEVKHYGKTPVREVID